MAVIDEQKQTYMNNGVEYDAHTGRPVSSPPILSPYSAPTNTSITPAVVSARQANEQVSTAISDYQTVQRTNAVQTATEAAKQPTKPVQQTQEEPLTLAFMNADGTTRQQTYYNPTQNRTQIQQLISTGWEPVSGTTPSGIGPGRTVQDVQRDQEYDGLVKELDTLRTNASTATQNYINSIKGIYEGRKRQMEDINTREQASLNAFGIASGAQRRTASFTGIISEAERQGIDRLTALDAEEQQLIAQAEQAHNAQDYEMLSKKMDLYFKNQEQKAAAMEKLQQAALAQNKLIQDRANELRKLEADKQKEFEKNIVDITRDAAKNGAPADIINAINGAKTIAEAVNAAGSYLKAMSAPSGIVAEYLFYKQQATEMGQTPLSFDDYQTRDANRKKPIINIGDGGIPNTTLTKMTTIAQGFDDDPIVKRFATAKEGRDFANSIPNDTNNATLQQGLIYAFAKAADPDSAVREGEYASVQKYAQSLAATYGFNAKRALSGGAFLSPTAIANIKAAIEQRYRAQLSSYGNFRTQQANKINNLSGKTDGADYLTDHANTLGDELLRQGQNDPLNLGVGAPVSNNNPLGI